nr:hypothetical protein [Saprospiraceae bacterium]
YLAKPMPDVLVELGFLLCFVAYYRTSFTTEKRMTPALVLFVMGTLLIFLSKETFLIIYPFFLLLLAADLWKRERWEFWKKVLFSVIAFLLFYFLYYWVATGNPLMRVEALFHDRYISECTYDLQPTEVMIRRIAYGMWFNFMKFGALIPIGFVLLLSKKYALSQGERFIFFSYLAVLLLSNFMTISYTSYVPLCDDTRHFLFVYPIAAMVVIIGFSHLNKMGLKHRAIIALTLILQWYITSSTYPENYFFIFIPIALGVFFWGKWKVTWPWALLVISGLFYQYISNVQYHRILNFPKQKKLIEYVLEKEAPVLIVTDPANSRIGNFYAGYRPEKHLFLSYKAYSELDSLPEGPVFFISNGMTSYHSNINWEEVPREITDAPQQLNPVMKNEAGEVYLLRE